jgi:oligopeptide/dipeptide ABC transporter ATP-binding protein
MYAGHIVELGPTREVMSAPRHPYTEALLRSYPRLHTANYDLQAIPGALPDLADPPAGCPFHPRCRYAISACRQGMPAPSHVGASHFARCIRVSETGDFTIDS